MFLTHFESSKSDIKRESYNQITDYCVETKFARENNYPYSIRTLLETNLNVIFIQFPTLTNTEQ